MLSNSSLSIIDVKTSHRASDGKPALKWVTDSDAVFYEVYRSREENGSYSKVFTTTGNSYTHVSAIDGKVYYYKVKAVLRDATEVYSDVVSNSWKISVEDIKIEVTASHREADGKPVLSWSKVPAAVQYQIYRAIDENSAGSVVFTTKGTTYTHASAVENKNYYYKVKAVLANGTELYSEVITNSCRVEEDNIDLLEVQNGFAADGKPLLTWTNMRDAKEYTVYRSDSRYGSYAKVFHTTGNSYTHVSAETGKAYYYKVKVILKDGTVLYSEVLSNIYT